jgi:hypothetical protein
MRLTFSLPALALASLVLSGCGDPQITTYKVPKEPVAVAAPADANHQHVHTGTPSAPAESGAPAPAAATAPAGGTTMANTPVATAAGAGLTWTAPAHWQSKGASGMRKGTITIPGEGGASAELAITAFPGDVGGDVANVNRWRGQIQLAQQSPDEVLSSIQRLEANGLKIGVIEMANAVGATPTRVLGAMVPFEGSTWFFKVTGPDALVAKEKDAFLAYLRTIKPANG